MRVLWVTPHFPDAQGSGGTVHQFELLRYVSRRHEITLLTSDWNIRGEKLQAVRDLGVEVRAVAWPWHKRPRTRVGRLIRLLAGAAPTILVWMNHRRLRPLAEAIAEEERIRRVDLVCIILGDLAPLVETTTAPTALMLFDVYSRVSDMMRGKGLHSLSSVRRWLERRNARRWEPYWYDRADEISCVTSIDADAVSSMLGRNVVAIPNPVPAEFFAPPKVARSTTTVTFVGAFSWEPNVDSARWICEEIWPRILSRRPDARLRIVGRYANDVLRTTVEAAGGELHSDVEDILPYYWEAAVVIAPIRMGSGMRNKVLHAMACGAPVVATHAALEGIPALAGEQLLVADDTAGLADAVVAVLNDPAAAQKRAEAAREIPARYTSESAGAALDAWWETAAAKGASRPPSETSSPRSGLTASVVVCTRERPDLLRRSLASVGAAAAAVPGTEVIVIEQGAPSAASICSELSSSAKVIRDGGVGVSRARNIGLRRAVGDVVLFTDDDCEVPIDWVRRHVDALTDPEVVASFGGVSGLSRWGDERYDHAALPSRHRSGSPPWLIGHSSNMAVLTSVLCSLGGFDERLGPGSFSRASGEDADLIVRLLRTGSVLASGTGEPVRHMEWRSTAEHRATVISYEHGAGVWIGKAIREHPRAALALLRWRVAQLREFGQNGVTTGDNHVPISAFAGAITRGLITGLRMKPWQGSAAGELASESKPPDSMAAR